AGSACWRVRAGSRRGIARIAGADIAVVAIDRGSGAVATAARVPCRAGIPIVARSADRRMLAYACRTAGIGGALVPVIAIDRGAAASPLDPRVPHRAGISVIARTAHQIVQTLTGRGIARIAGAGIPVVAVRTPAAGMAAAVAAEIALRADVAVVT